MNLCHKNASTPATEFFAEVEAAFDHAVRRTSGAIDRFIALAGSHIRLRFANDTLVVPMTRALQHLAASPTGSPDLTVALWDAASTGVPLPRPRWDIDAYGVRSEIAGYNDDTIHTIFQPNTGSLMMFDARRNLAIYAAIDGASLPTFETSVPLRPILHWWARQRGGLQMAHAAAVGNTDGCVLLIGDSGAGKSSTALACLQSSLLFLSDDYCLLETEGKPMAHCVYGIGKVSAPNLERMPFLKPLISNPWELDSEKAVFFLAEHFPHQLLARAPLRAILLPKVTDRRDLRIEPAPPAAALLTMAGTSHVQLPNAGAEVLRGLSRVVRQVPTFHLLLGNDVAQIGPAITRLLNECSA